jgi:hypothetical protein
LVSDSRRRAVDLADRLAAEVAANAILRPRDFAFVLYPEEKLHKFLTQRRPIA